MVARGAMNTYLNVVAFIINVVITFLVGNGIPGTQSNEVLSAKYQTLVTPVGWAFTIWAIIFGSQLVFTIVQTRPSFRGHRLVQDGVGYSYIGVCLAQATWGLVFGFELINLSVAFMLLILYFLVRIVMTQDKVDRDDAHINRDFFSVCLSLPHSLWLDCGRFFGQYQPCIGQEYCVCHCSVLHRISVVGLPFGDCFDLPLCKCVHRLCDPVCVGLGCCKFSKQLCRNPTPSPSYQTFSSHTTFFIRTHIYTHIVGYSRRAWYSQRSYRSYI